jgi:NTE family protein
VKELYLWNLHFRKKWVVSEDQIDRELSELLGGGEFSDTVIQFAACAADVKTGEEVVLNKGSLVRSILASCAIPGVFPPVELGGRLLVDGGVLGSVPTDAVRGLGAGFIIAVDVERELKFDRFEYGIDILLQCEAIRAFELKRIKLKGADVVIRPNVTHVAWPHFSKIKECIEAGEVATWEALPKIRELLRKKRRKLFIKRLFWPF